MLCSLVTCVRVARFLCVLRRDGGVRRLCLAGGSWLPGSCPRRGGPGGGLLGAGRLLFKRAAARAAPVSSATARFV